MHACRSTLEDPTAEADGYVTGIEPGTNYPNRRSVERAAGRVPKLAAGGSHMMTLEFGLHANGDEVRTILGEVSRLQGPESPILEPAQNK